MSKPKEDVRATISPETVGVRPKYGESLWSKLLSSVIARERLSEREVAAKIIVDDQYLNKMTKLDKKSIIRILRMELVADIHELSSKGKPLRSSKILRNHVMLVKQISMSEGGYGVEKIVDLFRPERIEVREESKPGTLGQLIGGGPKK